MNILAIETSSPVCSVALLSENQVFEKSELLANRHSEVVLQFIKDLLDQAQIKLPELDAIAVGNGPGSFTGLRLGLGVAQGLAYGIDKPLIPVSSLKVIAAQAQAEHILVAVDARLKEVYWQCFHRSGSGQLTELSTIQLAKPASIQLPDDQENWQGIGSGLDVYSETLVPSLIAKASWIKGSLPKADTLIQLAKLSIQKSAGIKVSDITPSYVRNKVTG